MNWNIKVNKKVHQTINEIPLDRLKDEHLSPILREYILDNVNVRKVEKESVIPTDNQKKLYKKYVTVVVLDNMLAAYHEDKQIALHKL